MFRSFWIAESVVHFLGWPCKTYCGWLHQLVSEPRVSNRMASKASESRGSVKRRVLKNLQSTIVLTLIVSAGLFLAPKAFAQMGMGQGMHMPKYDPTTVITIKGTVEEVQEGMMQSGQMSQMKGMGHMGMHLIVKTESESLTVLVGPSSFVKEKNFTFAKGDQIEVTGSKVKYDDKDAVIARDIKKGDKTLTLRNEKGIPEWSMGHQR